jgi:soluble lytic murein transglycosylase-like protein
VRIGTNPDRKGDSACAAAHEARKAVSILAVIASAVGLTVIIESHYGQLLTRSFPPADAAVQGETDVTASADEPPAAILTEVEESRHRAVSEFVAKRYRVSRQVSLDLVGQAHRVGKELQLDPLLIIAVMAIESSFNPIAESVAGAKGLMQIIPKYHTEKFEAFGGPESVFDPAINIRVGAQILKEYIRHTGNLGIALQMYAGALDDYEDRYTNKVIGMKQRLQHVVAQSPNRPANSVVRTASAGSGRASPLH